MACLENGGYVRILRAAERYQEERDKIQLAIDIAKASSSLRKEERIRELDGGMADVWAYYTSVVGVILDTCLVK